MMAKQDNQKNNQCSLVRCPWRQDLKIWCGEVRCEASCPIYAKESGQLAYSINEAHQKK